MSSSGDHQNSIGELPRISKNAFENLFKVYKQDDGIYFYNILRTMHFPDELDQKYYYTYTITSPEPLTNLSFKFYGDIELWWLICLANKIDNPVELLEGGTTIRVIRSKYIENIIKKLKDS